jgi:hypothetical protein
MIKHYKYSDIQNIKLCRVAKQFLLEDTSTTPQYIDHPQSLCYDLLIRMIKSFRKHKQLHNVHLSERLTTNCVVQNFGEAYLRKIILND